MTAPVTAFPALGSHMPSFSSSNATRSVATEDRPPQVSRVSIPSRPGEPPAQFRERLVRAAARLEAMLAATGQAPVRWMLRLDRAGSSAAMPLPPAALADVDKFERRLPNAALRGVERLVLEARVRPDDSLRGPVGAVATVRPESSASLPPAIHASA